MRLQLAAIFVARATVSTAQRIIYPFLPTIARGLGLSIGQASSLVTLRMVPGLAAPFLGPTAERYGRRRMMMAALLAYSLAGLLLGGIGTLAGVVCALLLFGLAKVMFDPSVYAYVGDTVPYGERGRTIGVLELSWSLAWLLGVPSAGFLIERFGWRSPWVVLAVLGVLSLSLIGLLLSPDRRPQARYEARPAMRSMLPEWRFVLRQRGVVAFLMVSGLLVLAIEIPFIVYGAWLESTFHLSLSTMGLASTVVGVAEATAELGTALFVDRWGKRRSVLIGLIALAAGLVMLPWMAQLGLFAALTGIALVVLAFEFAIVALLPLATELVPQARAAFLSFNVMAVTMGRMLGSIAGGWLWQGRDGNIATNALVGGACAVLAAVVLVVGLTEIKAPQAGSVHRPPEAARSNSQQHDAHDG